MINEIQQYTANHTEVPVFIVADLGSCKKKTMDDGSVYLVKKDVEPKAIMMSIFAENMLNRLQRQVGIGYIIVLGKQAKEILVM